MISIPIEIEGDWEQITAEAARHKHSRLRLTIVPQSDTTSPQDTRPIAEVLAEIAARVPPEEQAKIPSDFCDQLDHYTYGVPNPTVSADRRSLQEKIAEIMADVPEEEWAKLPSDLSDNLDHYIYGSPKLR